MLHSFGNNQIFSASAREVEVSNFMTPKSNPYISYRYLLCCDLTVSEMDVKSSSQDRAHIARIKKNSYNWKPVNDYYLFKYILRNVNKRVCKKTKTPIFKI